MPWWAIIYAVVFFAVCNFTGLSGKWDRSDYLRWSTQFVTSIVIVLLFVGFWLRSIYHSLGIAAPCMFIGILIWDIFSIPDSLRSFWKGQGREFTTAERIGLAVATFVLVAPIYVVAGIGAFAFRK